MPDDFMPTLREMVSYRNRAVHLYWEMDDEAVYRIVQEDLNDFDRFAALIAEYLERHEQDREE